MFTVTPSLHLQFPFLSVEVELYQPFERGWWNSDNMLTNYAHNTYIYLALPQIWTSGCVGQSFPHQFPQRIPNNKMYLKKNIVNQVIACNIKVWCLMTWDTSVYWMHINNQCWCWLHVTINISGYMWSVLLTDPGHRGLCLGSLALAWVLVNTQCVHAPKG